MKITSKVADDSQIIEAIKRWNKDYDLSIYALEIPAMYKQVDPGTMLYAMDEFSLEEYDALKKHGSYVMKDHPSVFCWTSNSEDLTGVLKHFSIFGASLIEKNVSEFEVVLNFAYFISQNKEYGKELAGLPSMQNMIFIKSTETARTISFSQVRLRPFG